MEKSKSIAPQNNEQSLSNKIKKSAMAIGILASSLGVASCSNETVTQQPNKIEQVSNDNTSSANESNIQTIELDTSPMPPELEKYRDMSVKEFHDIYREDGEGFYAYLTWLHRNDAYYINEYAKSYKETPSPLGDNLKKFKNVSSITPGSSAEDVYAYMSNLQLINELVIGREERDGQIYFSNFRDYLKNKLAYLFLDEDSQFLSHMDELYQNDSDFKNKIDQEALPCTFRDFSNSWTPVGINGYEIELGPHFNFLNVDSIADISDNGWVQFDRINWNPDILIGTGEEGNLIGAVPKKVGAFTASPVIAPSFYKFDVYLGTDIKQKEITQCQDKTDDISLYLVSGLVIPVNNYKGELSYFTRYNIAATR